MGQDWENIVAAHCAC